MNPQIAALIERIKSLEAELDVELAQRAAGLRIGLEHGRIIFGQELLRRHRELQVKLSSYLLNARPMVVLTAPIIYSLIVPFVLLDLFITIYQVACFPVYGIPKVRRRDYIAFDRGHLAYLNAIEKLNCTYCSYANGLIAYVREITSRTEQYWCPIKHATRVMGSHGRYSGFEDYGDAEGYRSQLDRHRASLKKDKRPPE
ncbi:MAG TPA: hypothetical protein VFE34_15565 [Dongiaceae bacterium]|jgi:hypothetical protein|nr:hypothetical protein [Dongiaceae bacterium]